MLASGAVQVEAGGAVRDCRETRLDSRLTHILNLQKPLIQQQAQTFDVLLTHLTQRLASQKHASNIA